MKTQPVDFLTDLDHALLETVLDFIVDTANLSQPSRVVKDKVKLRRDGLFLSIIVSAFKHGNWDKGWHQDQINPMVCLSCLQLDCCHIQEQQHTPNIDEILATATTNCTHQTDTLNICAVCVIDAIPPKQTSSGEIVEVWDSYDLAQFALWVEELDLQFGLLN